MNNVRHVKLTEEQLDTPVNHLSLLRHYSIEGEFSHRDYIYEDEDAKDRYCGVKISDAEKQEIECRRLKTMRLAAIIGKKGALPSGVFGEKDSFDGNRTYEPFDVVVFGTGDKVRLISGFSNADYQSETSSKPECSERHKTLRHDIRGTEVGTYFASPHILNIEPIDETERAVIEKYKSMTQLTAKENPLTVRDITVLNDMLRRHNKSKLAKETTKDSV
jgi:hypothetical protein